MVKFPITETQHEFGVLPYEVKEDKAWRRVVRSIEEFGFSHLLIALNESLETLRIQGTNWLFQISECFGIGEVKMIRFVVTDYPRKNWVLCQVLKCAIGPSGRTI